MASMQQRQVSSLLHDELQCLTVSGLATRLGVSRSTAAHLLEEAARDKTKSDRSYQANYVVEKQEKTNDVSCTVFRLVAKEYTPESSNNEFLYSMAVGSNASEPCESLAAAHERDMAYYRDLLTDNTLQTVLCELSKFDCIAPHPSIHSAFQESLQQASKAPEGDVPVASATSSSATLARGGPKKVTTAASFFASKKEKTMMTTTATTKSTNPAKTVKATSKDEAMSEEKENHVSSSKNTKGTSKIGTVDDFVGDEESDDDSDDDSMDAKIAATGEKKPRALLDDDEDSDDDDGHLQTKPMKKKTNGSDSAVTAPQEKTKKKRKEEPTVVSGAMDAFATKKDKAETNTAPATKHKRRRKKLVERTTMDASGYLHTETQEIWEDILSDEEDSEVVSQISTKKMEATKPNASKKAPAAMKQGSIMGFFKKK